MNDKISDMVKDFERKAINEVFTGIVECFEEAYGLILDDMIYDDRRVMVDYRSIFSHYCREMGFRIMYIGKRLDKDHSTIVYYLKKYEDLYKFDADFRSKADRLSEILKNKELI